MPASTVLPAQYTRRQCHVRENFAVPKLGDLSAVGDGAEFACAPRVPEGEGRSRRVCTHKHFYVSAWDPARGSRCHLPI
eukprot:2983359-Prymnesium_polylepis.1